ncbi:UNVERIFIED_CONTAM: hypothetical protein HDU68_003760 [Siphonaria sp. JEL0065]|nr:hypothetical protein HDU68_003760 [Siphonaria sp. JEL0065]
MCKVFGPIQSSKAILDLTTNECKGFGFVRYETPEYAQNALRELLNMGYNVTFAKETFNTRLKTLQDQDNTNLYVSNLPLNMDEQALQAFLASDHVLSTKILRDDQTQLSRGVGFARIDSRANAQALISEFNGKPLENGQCLQVRFADSSAQKKFKITQQSFRGGGVQSHKSPTNRGVKQYSGETGGNTQYLAYYDSFVNK